MYNSLKETYTPLTDANEHDVVMSKIIIIKYPQGASATGPLSSVPMFTWENMRYFWSLAIQKIYNTWYAYLSAALIGDDSKRNAAKTQTSALLNELSSELQKKYSGVLFQFFIATPAGIVRAHGGNIAHAKEVQTLLGMAEAFTGKILCTTRHFDEQSKKLSDFFTCGFCYYNKTAGTSYSHVLQVVVGRM